MAERWAWLRRPVVNEHPVRNELLWRVRATRAAAAGAITSMVAVVTWGTLAQPIQGSGPIFTVFDLRDQTTREVAVTGIAVMVASMVVAAALWTLLVDWRRNGRLPRRSISTAERVINGCIGGGAALLGGPILAALGGARWSLEAVDGQAQELSFAVIPAAMAWDLVLVIWIITTILGVLQLLFSAAAAGEPVPARV